MTKAHFKQGSLPDTKIEVLEVFKGNDLNDLCEATERTVIDNALSFSMGILRKDPLVRERLESYWRGVLLVPERKLVVGRLDGVIASSIQLVLPGPNNQTSYFAAEIDQHFVAPWARGYGLARELLVQAELLARKCDIRLLKLSVRSTLETAVRLYEQMGYKKWGVLEHYEEVDGEMLSGYFYCKELNDDNISCN